MRTRIAAFTVAVLVVLPVRDLAQEFPPPEQAARVRDGDEARPVKFPIGVTVGVGFPAGDVVEGQAFKDTFASLRSLRLDAGIAGENAGVGFVYRYGDATVADRRCPAGDSCTGTFKTVGGALLLMPGGTKESVIPILSIGGGTTTGEILRSAGDFERYTGWELFTTLSVNWRLGDASSPFGLGFSIAGHMMSLGHEETPAGKVELPVAKTGTPTWIELGVRASFL
ncbi:MAG: hypothetical protein WCC48_13485 [Anaeromyxobacteraceae bacterium]